MLVRNTGSEEVRIAMESRALRLEADEHAVLTPEEVRDPSLRRGLQERSLSIVRPATKDEVEGLRDRLEDDKE